MSYKDNNEVREIKRQATTLRAYLASQGVAVPHSMALEAVSRLLSDKFWNVTRAKAQPFGQRRTLEMTPVPTGLSTKGYVREEGALRVWLASDWNFPGQFEMHVSHPLLGHPACQINVWWNADLVMEEWKQCLLDMVFDGIHPLVDDALTASSQEREDEAFEVLALCCMRSGITDGEVQEYAALVVNEWETRS